MTDEELTETTMHLIRAEDAADADRAFIDAALAWIRLGTEPIGQRSVTIQGNHSDGFCCFRFTVTDTVSPILLVFKDTHIATTDDIEEEWQRGLAEARRMRENPAEDIQ